MFLTLAGFSLEAGEPPRHEHSYILKVDDKCHTQGIDINRDKLYVTCVARQERRAYLYEVSLPDLLELRESSGMSISVSRKDLTMEGEYHPSGIGVEGVCLWVAVAEYHPEPATSTVMCVDVDSMNMRSQFSVNDHIGAVAASSDRIFGANWDAKIFYVWDWWGNEKGRGPSPTGVAYQDCEYMEPDHLLCGGVSAYPGLIRKRAHLDLIKINGDDVSKWKLKKRVVVYRPYPSAPAMTREGFCYNNGKFYFMPQDFPDPTLYEYSIDEMTPEKQ